MSKSVLWLVAGVLMATAGAPAAQEAASPAEVDRVTKIVKPQPGESRWLDVPWLTDLWAARKKAAAEGKPLFLWIGTGGAPLAVT